jgi:hypothetical protein
MESKEGSGRENKRLKKERESDGHALIPKLQ